MPFRTDSHLGMLRSVFWLKVEKEKFLHIDQHAVPRVTIAAQRRRPLGACPIETKKAIFETVIAAIIIRAITQPLPFPDSHHPNPISNRLAAGRRPSFACRLINRLWARTPFHMSTKHAAPRRASSWFGHRSSTFRGPSSIRHHLIP